MIRERVARASIPSMSASWSAKASKRTGPTSSPTLEFEPLVDARFAAIKQGFDHIRGRKPKR